MAMTTAQKFRIKAGDTVRLLAAPADYPDRLGPLPEGVTFTDDAANPAAIHWLVNTVAELSDSFPGLRQELTEAGRVWIVYPRKKKYASGDANRDSIWQYLKTQGWTAVANYPVDDGLSAVWAKPDS